jgi:hypothetical protein
MIWIPIGLCALACIAFPLVHWIAPPLLSKIFRDGVKAHAEAQIAELREELGRLGVTMTGMAEAQSRFQVIDNPTYAVAPPPPRSIKQVASNMRRAAKGK